MLRSSRLVLAAFSLALAVVGCDRVTAPDAVPTVPPRAPQAPQTLLGLPLLGGLRLLPCPGTTTTSASAVIGPEGGALTLGGFRVDFPAGAVDAARTFVLTV